MKFRIIMPAFLMALLLIVSVNALSLSVDNPVDGEIYDSDRSIVFDLESDEIADFYIMKDIYRPAGWRMLCRSKTKCVKNVRLREGDNRVMIKIINLRGQTDVSDPISFFIDTRNPRISKTLPRRNTVTNGDEFKVFYNEANIQKVTLFYGRGIDRLSITRNDCPSGKREECVFSNIDLSAFDGKDIDYWFEIEDLAENRGVSKVTKVYVDTQDPIVNHKEFQISRRRVNFVFDIEEINFDKIVYIDKEDRNPRWKTLCSRLKLGRCDPSKSFRRGAHILDIKVTDKAGNEEDIYTDLLIEI